ncbi:MAG TPA: helix-turn-helix domain-containing protein [Ornithinibacter sp.]|nr:helix-turn-helix domain-containing protein [Ornithinibacter sp.]
MPSQGQTAARPSVDLEALPSEPAARVGALEQIVEQQAALLEREDEVHRVLVRIVLAGGALAELSDAVAGFFQGAAVVATTDGRVLAMAGADAEVERTRALDCFDRTGRLVVESEPVGPRDPDSPGSTRAFVKIVAGASDHGLLGAFSPERPLTAADVHLLERAATVAALAITKEQAVAAVESKYRAEFLRDALAGRAGEPADAVSHAASLGWDIARPMVVVVADTDENDEETTRSPDEVRSLQERFVRAWVQAVRARDTSVPVAGFSQEVVALVPVGPDSDADAVMRTVGEIAKVVRGDGGGGRRSFSTGVSRPITSVADLPAAYDEALKAVHVGRQMHGESALTHFDGLGIYRLLALIPDGADLRRFVDESLGELAHDDSQENADLRRTLSVLIDTNLNVAETARQLFFHYNTLRYRIAKLERMLGPFTSDPQLRLTLALALRIHQMRGI